MKSILFTLLCCFPSMLVVGQINLVLNPDFELHKSCNFFGGAIHSKEDSSVVNNWLGASRYGTSDYHHTCSVDPIWYNLPLSTLNFQRDYNGKIGYALIFVTGVSKWNNNTVEKEFREYIQTKLRNTLKPQKYCVGAYVNICLKENSGITYAPLSAVAIKNLGIHLSKDRPFNDGKDTSNPYILKVTPQIVSNQYLQDTANWELVAGIYEAQGDENWLTIGNFSTEWQTDQLPLIKNSDARGFIAYLIDHVFAIPMEDGGLLGADTVVCSSSFPLQLTAAEGLSQLHWNTGDTTQSIMVNGPGSYAVTTNKYGCLIRDTIRIAAKSADSIAANLVDTTICAKELPLEYVCANVDALTDLKWSDGTTGPKVKIAEAGFKVLTALNSCGQPWRDTLNVRTISPPVVKVIGDSSICKNDEVQSIVLRSAAGLEQYKWSTGATQSSILVQEAGLYRLFSQNICGTFSDSVMVKGCQSKVFVPNVFCPTQSLDNANAVFQPYFSNAQLVDLEIFDRWGGLVYRAVGSKAQWDGTADGKLCPSGTYVYKIRYIDYYDQTEKWLAGDVGLVQ